MIELMLAKELIVIKINKLVKNVIYVVFGILLIKTLSFNHIIVMVAAI